jgi:hypothetical protein
MICLQFRCVLHIPPIINFILVNRDLYTGILYLRGVTNLVKNDRGDLLADPHNILNYFCQLLNVQEAGDVRQSVIQTGEPSVP